MDGETLLKKTLKTVGLMVGACVALSGVLTLVALLIVSRAVGSDGAKNDGPAVIPASKLDGQRPPSTPLPKSTTKKTELPPGATRPT